MTKSLSRPADSLRSAWLTALAAILPVFLGYSAWAAKPASPPPAQPTVFVQIRYFFTIDLDPRYQIAGTGELTEDEATRAKCYRFIYDRTGKLKQVEYRSAGIPLPDPYFGVASVDFEYQPGIERRWYRDAQGQPANNADGVAGEELTLNPAGYPTDIANLDASGARTRDSQGVIHYVRTLDDHNRLVRGQGIGLLGTAITDNNGSFETRIVYDDQNRPLERGNYDASGNLLNNNDGVALTRTTYTLYPDSTQSVESYSDSSGLAVEARSSGVHELQSTIDKRGLLLSESYFDTTGAPILDSQGEIHERRYTYDNRGNEISEQFFDTEGKPKDHKVSGFARIVYKYDKRNWIIEKAFFGDDGAPAIVPYIGAAVVRQEYDAKGTIVRLQFFDGQGHPTPSSLYGAPAIRIEVDGDRTMVRLCDAKDHLTVNPVGGYAAFSYKTNSDKPLTSTNHYYNRHGRTLTWFPRVSVINPHLYALRQPENWVMKYSARYGAAAAGLGALLGCFLALRKSSHTKRRKVYVPSPLERFLGWFAVFAILEGTLRFFMTVYWWWLDHQYVRMSHGVYYVETFFILFFLYRLYRMHVTMRVLNIEREDIHRLVRDFFTKAGLKPEWIETRRTYATAYLAVRIRFFRQKYHAYLAFRRHHAEGRSLARDLATYIRAQVGGIQAPPRSRAIAFYYPSVAFCYLLLSGLAFYTLWQVVKHY